MRSDNDAEPEAGSVPPTVIAAPDQAGLAAPGPASAAGAARALMCAGPPPRITPRAVLALQRAAGNRAVGRQMLMRYDWDRDGIDDPDEPYVVSATGPNDAAAQASAHTRERGACNIVVLDARSLFVYDTTGKPKGRFELLVPTAWSPGVFVSGKRRGEPTPFLRVYLVKGELAWSAERDPGGPVGGLLAKPPQNAVPDSGPAGPGSGKPRFTAGLPSIVTDGKGLREALSADDTLLVIPRYTAGRKGAAGGGKDGKAGSDTAGLSGKDGGEPPNAPAYPSYITGNDVQVAGGRSSYTMELVYGSNSIGNTLAAMVGVTYTWERWELTNATKDAPAAALEGAAIAARKRDAEHESGAMEAAGRRWGDAYREERERMAAAWHHKAAKGQSRISALKDRFANDVALALAPASWLVAVGGNLIDSAIDARPQRRVEKEMPWPAKEGLYLIRCVAQPDAVVDGKAPDGSDVVVRRAPSVSTMLVEVKDPRAVAQEAIDKPEADLARADAEIALAKARGASERELAELAKQRERVRLSARGSSVELLFEALRVKQKELSEADPADLIKKRRLTEEADSIRAQIDLTGKRLHEVDPSGKAVAIRLPATFVSKVGGQPYPLLLDLIEYPDSKEGAYHYRLSDVTSKDAAANPEATGTTRREAIWTLLTLYCQRSGLGAGTLAARIPPEADGGQGDVFKGATLDIGWELAKKRLADVALIASIVGTALLGPAAAVGGRVLMVAGAVGGAAAALNLADRWDSNTLRWDSAAVNDVIAVLGAVAPGVAAIGRLRILRYQSLSVFAVAGGDVAAAESALASLRTTERGLALFEQINHAINYAGVFVAGAEAIEEIQRIGRAERAGEISHNEAERRRAGAFSGAALNLGLFVYGEARQAAERRVNEGGLTDAELRKKRAAEEEADRRIAEHGGLEPARVKEAGGGGAGRPPGAPPAADHAPPSEPSRKPTRPEATERFKKAVAAGGDAGEAALDLIRTVGEWKTAIRDAIAGLPNDTRARAETALVEARDRIVDRAWEKAQASNPRFRDLVRLNVGTKAFASDIDITIRPNEEMLRAAGTDIALMIAWCTDAAIAYKEALRAEVGGRETDVAIDTNVYSFIGEGVLIPETAAERATRADLDRVVGLAETLRGAGRGGFAELLAQIRGRLAGAPDAIARLNELALRATKFADARAAEEAAARREVRAKHGDQPAATENRMVRDRIVEAKKIRLAHEVMKEPLDIDAITQLQSEILWFEPDAYATRAAIEQAVTQAQSLKAAGQAVTPAEEVAAARAAHEAAQRGGDAAEIARAGDRLAKATADRDAIVAEAAKLEALEHEAVGDDPAARSAHEQRVREQLRALDAAQNRFRSRMVGGAVADIQSALDARGYTPAEQRALGSAAAASNLGLMMDHISHTTDPGGKVKYVCKYGGRVLLALVQGGVQASGSIAAESLLAMFTRSRWTFMEGEPGRVLMRDMLIRYAAATGRPVNTENGRVVGVPAETQLAFVRDMTSWLHGAAARLWTVGLTEETAAGTARERLRSTVEQELGRTLTDREGTYQPSTSLAYADLPRNYRLGMEALAGSTDENAVAVRDRLMPVVIKALRGPRQYAAVMADAATLAKARGIDVNAALVELAKRTGLPVTVLEKTPRGYGGGEFFTKVVSKAEYFVDNDIDTVHGHMTHLLQDLAVDRALTEAGIAERSPQVRARLGRLTGTTRDGLDVGDSLWRGTYDNEVTRDFGTPEMLKEILKKYGVD